MKILTLGVIAKYYKVSKTKIEGIWNSLFSYKRHFGEYLKAFYTDRNEKSRILCGSI
jgi:hypothetical protein